MTEDSYVPTLPIGWVRDDTMYTATVTATFEATHSLRLYDGHAEPDHGHSWRVRACFSSAELDEIGVVVDFTYARDQLSRMAAELAGCRLNEWPVLQGGNPSAERVAEAFFRRLSADPRLAPALRAVHVTEAQGCEAGYAPGGFSPGLMDGPIIDDKALDY